MPPLSVKAGYDSVCPVAGKVLAPQLDEGSDEPSQACTAVVDNASPTSNARLLFMVPLFMVPLFMVPLFMVLTSRFRQYCRWIASPSCNKTTCNDNPCGLTHQD